MTEPRMRVRQKGQHFPTADLEAYLVAFGDDRNPLPETVRVLDEIVTDFIIETCHEAAQTASYSRRSKVKVEDFKFVLRKDPRKLGRVTELLNMDRDIKSKRKAFVVDEDQIGKVEVKDDGSGAAVAEGKAGKAEVTGEGKVRKKDGAGRAQKRQRVKKG